MKLIVGLGNPGNRYSFTRHNIGYLILDYLAEYLNLEFKPAKDEWYGTESEYEGNKFYLMKPTTFMNNSGFAVLNYFAKTTWRSTRPIWWRLSTRRCIAAKWTPASAAF